MERKVVRPKAFKRHLRRYLKKHPELDASIEETLELLVHDAFDPKLKTHKLTGELADLWACSAGYDLRILFRILSGQPQEEIVLVTIGSHDDVY